MSWGERSCKHYEGGEVRPCMPTMDTCNVACPHYVSNGREPDSTTAGARAMAEILRDGGIKDTTHADRLVKLAGEDRDAVAEGVKHNKVAAQAKTKSDNEYQYAKFLARAAESAKHKGKGRRRMTRDWTLAPVGG